MHAGRIARIIGQAAAASLLGLGVVGFAAPAHANDYDRDISSPSTSVTSDGETSATVTDGGIFTTFDWDWD